MNLRRHFDAATVVVILLTLVLFVLALFFKGLTHDLLLEAGVFLVSVKLILMAYKQSVEEADTRKRLDTIAERLDRLLESRTRDAD